MSYLGGASSFRASKTENKFLAWRMLRFYEVPKPLLLWVSSIRFLKYSL